jgi:hypothetical protein
VLLTITLNQFYAARSTIAHGSSLGKKELEFKPDKGEHRSLVYWARRIFRACVEATVSQWETARRRGLLKLMTPNRIRLNRILGKLRDTPGEKLLQSIPDDIRTDIRDLHASWIDIPDESYLEQTAHINRVLSSIAVKSPSLEGSELCALFSEILSLPQDWYREVKFRGKARGIWATILEKFGDEATILNPPIELEAENELEQVLYHWAKFAYTHISSIDW